MSDAADLHQALCRGRWRRLVDPLLEPALLARPDVWPTIVRNCAERLAIDALEDDGEAVGVVFAWANRVAPGPTVVGLLLLTQRPGAPVTARGLISQAAASVPLDARAGALLALARQAVARQPSPERVEALAVLGRWPVG